MRDRNAAVTLLLALTLLPLALLRAQSPTRGGPAGKTPAEDSQFTRYSLSEDVARYLQAVDRASRETSVIPIGVTAPARDFPAALLYLCVITAEGVDKSKSLNRTKPTVMVMASQHGDEQSGKEAALQLVRDLALGDLRPLLRKANFLIVPQTNPYGNWGNRVPNEQGVDLDRDHVRLLAPETAALHSVFREWMPEVTLDVHEKGDDYFRVSTGCAANANIDPAIETFSRDALLPAVGKAVTAAGFTWHESVVTEAMSSTAGGPGLDRRERDRTPEMSAHLGTTDIDDGRNSFGVYETISCIQEGASRRNIETLKARTDWQRAGLRAMVETVAARGAEVVRLVRSRRAALQETAKSYALDNLVHLRMDYVRDPRQPELVLQKFAPEAAPSAGQTRQAPVDPGVVTEVVRDWFPLVEPRLTVPRPLGYLVPATYGGVVQTLLRHGITLEVVTADTTLDVESYRVTVVVPAREDQAAPERLEADRRMARVMARKGDFYVTSVQPAATLIPSLLEPQSEFGLIRYRSFNLLPEPGTTWPFHRVVVTGQLPLVPYLPSATAK